MAVLSCRRAGVLVPKAEWQVGQPGHIGLETTAFSSD